MPKLDLDSIPVKAHTSYPGKLAEEMAGRSSRRLAGPGGITQFGVNLVYLEPGAKSSLRHYHMEQDEFVMVADGELTLVDDTGAHAMRSGDCAAFPRGDANGHHLINRSQAPASILVIGTNTAVETAYYSDLDMMVRIDAKGFEYTRKDESPLSEAETGEQE